jgi:hypothetical protein
MHFVRTGGFNGFIEYFDRMVARILPFRKRILTKTFNPISDKFKKLEEFNSPDFLNKVKTICLDKGLTGRSNDAKKPSENKNIINELYQLDLLLMLPGQELPMHLNVPYFVGADRTTLPQWLLVAMKNSKLFDHLYIHQVQGFVELELDPRRADFDPKQDEYVEINGDGGDFYLYPYLSDSQTNAENFNKYIILKSRHNSLVLLDGAQVSHGVDRYKANQLPPLFSASHHYNIKFDDLKWTLSDSKQQYLRSYSKLEVKLQVVWNQHCFETAEQKRQFEQAPRLTLDEIKQVFKSDLAKKKRLPSEEIAAIDLWTIVLKEYLIYPVNTHNQNSTIFGFNYCLLPNILPQWVTEKFLKNILLKRC